MGEIEKSTLEEKRKRGKPKGSPKTGGRVAGVPNKSTAEMKAAIAAFTSGSSEHLTNWLNEIEDPAKRLDLYFKALEYHIPKLARTEVAGDPNAPLTVTVFKFQDE